MCFVFTYRNAQAIVYALYDLCGHPKYMDALREEITQHSKENAAGNYYEHMPLLTVFSKSRQDSVLPILVCSLLSSSPDPNHCPTSSHCDSHHKPICPPYSSSNPLIDPPVVSLRRKAIAPYNFSDGVRVNPGDVACIPMRAIMADEDHYPAAATFNGYRFVNDTNTGSMAKVTDVETKFPIWGFGRRAW